MNEQEFWAILHAPVDVKPIFYRLYYNDDGTPICYSMEELPHNYIELTAEQYHQSPPNVRVVDGQLIIIKPSTYVKKLTPDIQGVACDPRDVCVVVDETKSNVKWSMKNYETS